MKQIIKRYLAPILIVISICGWGGTGHKIINRKMIYSFPSSMSAFYWWADSLSKHASDADYRKNSDPSESPRHYIDIDNYPEFLTTGRIPQSLDSLIAIHGNYFVLDNGILPFAIIATTDSVKKYFQLHDWQKAMLKAADLGHYIADAHMPLHLTKNYDGQYTNQTGIHSRYETQMINADSSLIIYQGDSCNYVSNINEFVFSFIYNDYKYVDSVLKSDSISHLIAGNYGSAYLQQLWQRTGLFTIHLFKKSSNYLSKLIYTAWINAGSPLPTSINQNTTIVKNYELFQNYPNPFNSRTKIKFNVKSALNNRGNEKVQLIIYDIKGNKIQTLFNDNLKSKEYEFIFDGSNLNSGIYFYKIFIDNMTESKKMLYIK